MPLTPAQAYKPIFEVEDHLFSSSILKIFIYTVYSHNGRNSLNISASTSRVETPAWHPNFSDFSVGQMTCLGGSDGRPPVNACFTLCYAGPAVSLQQTGRGLATPLDIVQELGEGSMVGNHSMTSLVMLSDFTTKAASSEPAFSKKMNTRDCVPKWIVQLCLK